MQTVGGVAWSGVARRQERHERREQGGRRDPCQHELHQEATGCPDRRLNARTCASCSWSIFAQARGSMRDGRMTPWTTPGMAGKWEGGGKDAATTGVAPTPAKATPSRLARQIRGDDASVQRLFNFGHPRLSYARLASLFFPSVNKYSSF